MNGSIEKERSLNPDLDVNVFICVKTKRRLNPLIGNNMLRGKSFSPKVI